uniref:Uncharacterized protein n=1 Tax=Pristionchus pacificus TaxID=54126 RepID=A0A2A6D065_PRIPA|eukprot:PDM83663.1 hypothetical protein PRIPAC_30150 [Pristionchus pacificus]
MHRLTHHRPIPALTGNSAWPQQLQVPSGNEKVKDERNEGRERGGEISEDRRVIGMRKNALPGEGGEEKVAAVKYERPLMPTYVYESEAMERAETHGRSADEKEREGTVGRMTKEKRKGLRLMVKVRMT